SGGRVSSPAGRDGRGSASPVSRRWRTAGPLSRRRSVASRILSWTERPVWSSRPASQRPFGRPWSGSWAIESSGGLSGPLGASAPASAFPGPLRPRRPSRPTELACEARADHRQRRPGRLVPRRASARRGLHRGRAHAPWRAGLREPLRARAHRAVRGRPPESDIARASLAGGRAGGGLQPRRAVLRADLLGTTGPDGGVRRCGCDLAPRGDTQRRSLDPLLPGFLVGDLRRAARDAADGSDATRACDPLRRREGIRALHRALISSVLWTVRLLRDSLQPRIAAAAAEVLAA